VRGTPPSGRDAKASLTGKVAYPPFGEGRFSVPPRRGGKRPRGIWARERTYKNPTLGFLRTSERIASLFARLGSLGESELAYAS